MFLLFAGDIHVLCVCVIYRAFQDTPWNVKWIQFLPSRKTTTTFSHGWFLFGVHENRIEFIVANWISVFIVFIFPLCRCGWWLQWRWQNQRWLSYFFCCWPKHATSIHTKRLVTCNKTKSTSVHFIYQSASEPIISIIISEILRIMFALCVCA